MMLINATTLENYALHSLDGTIGTVKEFYFDDHHWTIRYLIADTGTWLIERQVLLSPYAVTAVHTDAHTITINLTNKQIEDSPSIDRDKPVSRQFEEDYSSYYGWPTYWGGAFPWGMTPYLQRDASSWQAIAQDEKRWDPHLRSTRDVQGHHLQATDGDIGHVVDFLIDDETWAIRYFVVDTRNWWPGKQVLIAPQWIERISWSASKIFVHLLRETIKQAPAYPDAGPITRAYETQLHAYYQRQGYWGDAPVIQEPAHTA